MIWSYSVNLRTVIASTGDLLPPQLAIPLRASIGQNREPELSLINSLLGPGEDAVDVGANKGTWTFRLLAAVGATGRIVAVEPQSDLWRDLTRGFRHRKSATIINCALSEKEGTARLQIPLKGKRPVRGHASLELVNGDAISELVQLRTLDSVVSEYQLRPRLIKIDVEGHEPSVLEGGKETLTKFLPRLIVEINETSGDELANHIISLLERLGAYRPHILDRGSLQTVSCWPPKKQRMSPNVIFLPDGEIHSQSQSV